MPKTCSICKLKKSNDEFYVRDKKKNRLHAQCKQCYRDRRVRFAKEHYEKYGDEYRSRAMLRKKIQKQARQEKLVEFLSDKYCENCGFSDIRALDFDHIEPSKKKFGIARAINDGYRWEKIEEKIKKCRILCANCHKNKNSRRSKLEKMAPWPSG